MVNIPGDIGDVLQHNTALKVNLSKLSWIGLTSPETLVMLASESSPYSTFAQLKAAKTTVVYGGSKSGISWVGGATLLRAFHIPTKFLTGYGTEVAVSQGLVSNEFDVCFGDIAGAFYSDIVATRPSCYWCQGRPQYQALRRLYLAFHKHRR
jgi:tripartite-type tricarboxylate transporter receptor subunit TctC